MFMLVGVAAYRQIAVADLLVGIDFYSQIATNQPNEYLTRILRILYDAGLQADLWPCN